MIEYQLIIPSISYTTIYINIISNIFTSISYTIIVKYHLYIYIAYLYIIYLYQYTIPIYYSGILSIYTIITSLFWVTWWVTWVHLSGHRKPKPAPRSRIQAWTKVNGTATWGSLYVKMGKSGQNIRKLWENRGKYETTMRKLWENRGNMENKMRNYGKIWKIV